MLDFSSEFGVAVFESVCFIGSRFFSSYWLFVLSAVLIFFLAMCVFL